MPRAEHPATASLADRTVADFGEQWAESGGSEGTRLPHRALSALCDLLNPLLGAYLWLCRFLPLPLRSYARGTRARHSWTLLAEKAE
jgi:hypothetical protein